MSANLISDGWVNGHPDKCDDDIFLKFLENCVHPIVLPDEDEVKEVLSIFNSILIRDGYALREVSRISAKPVYKGMKLKGGVQGNAKNLIFAAKGSKPEIVLIDSVNNDIQIVENEENCLVYSKPILERGLLWADLIDWWSEQPQEALLTRRHVSVGQRRG